MAVVAAVALVAVASAAPVAVEEEGNYLREDIRAAIKQIREKFAVKIDELKKTRDDIRKQLREAKDDAKVQLKEKFEMITKKLVEEYRKLSDELKNILRKKADTETTYFREGLWAKIKELREKISSITKQIASIVKEQAVAKTESAKEALAAAKEKLIAKLGEVKDELLLRMRELMIPDDDVPVNYVVDEALEQILANLKEQLQDAVSVIADWRNMLTDAGREKVSAAKARVTELLNKIRNTISEWRKGKKEHQSEDATNYAADYALNGLLTKLREHIAVLIKQLNSKKAELKDAAIEKRDEVLAQIAALKKELSDAMNDFKKTLKEIFRGQQHGETYDLHDTLKELRAKLEAKLQQLKELLAKHATDQSEAIKETITQVKTEVSKLRDLIQSTLKDIFKKNPNAVIF